jgi:hypothetical protein
VSDEEVLAQLRDIHLPAEIAGSTAIEFAAWPLIALAVAVGAILLVRFLIRDQWRRRARAELSRITDIDDQGAQWSQLLAFATGLSSRAGRAVTLPDLAYRHHDTITDSERTAFITHLSAELGR